MIKPYPVARVLFQRQPLYTILQLRRPISINSAIQRGIRGATHRQSSNSGDSFPSFGTPRSPRTTRKPANNQASARSTQNTRDGRRYKNEDARASGLPQSRTSRERENEQRAAQFQSKVARVSRLESHNVGTSLARRPERSSVGPVSIPYATAASEFLYGYSVVLAALKAGRRKVYNLYLHSRALKNEGVIAIRVRANQMDVKIHEVDDAWLSTMDKVSSGRPHNGFVLETSPLPRPPVSSLGVPSMANELYKVVVDPQSREELAINGAKTEYKYKSDKWRHPFILYADGILDEGNLGALIRSAYYLGVDAIALPTRASAPLSHVALKAAAGAAEAIPIFSVANPSDFLAGSSKEGWRIYASDAMPPPARSFIRTPSSEQPKDNNIVFMYGRNNKRLPNHSPLSSHPTILMLGGEGTGLRGSLLAKAHYKVSIPAARDVNEIGVDSLNETDKRLGDLLF